MRGLFTLMITLVSTTLLLNATEDNNMTENTIVLVETNKGDFKIKLYNDKAPETVKNFLSYVSDGFYDGTIFHRVIDGFMIQGGGFTKDMDQKPTKSPIKNEAGNGVSNMRGTIAMARTSDVNSATAQFFINVEDNSFLNHVSEDPHEYGYCAFGHVTEGMEIVDEIKSVQTTNAAGHGDVPAKAIEILSVKKVEK